MFDCIAVLHSLVCSYIQEFKKQMIFSSLDLAVIVCVFDIYIYIYLLGVLCVKDLIQLWVKRNPADSYMF